MDRLASFLRRNAKAIATLVPLPVLAAVGAVTGLDVPTLTGVVASVLVYASTWLAPKNQ